MQHLLWVNESADRIGGCERYIEETVAHLHARFGTRSTLLYRDLSGRVDRELTEVFTRSGGGVFPLVEPERQIAALSPDLIYVHRLTGTGTICPLARVATARHLPLVRFFHDYQLFCPREHKYTTLGKHTCDRAVGAGCLGCLGFVRRSESFPGVALRSTGELLREQQENRAVLDAVVVASRHMGREVAIHGFTAEQTHVLPLYAREDATAAMPASPREPDHLLFVGQLITGKGVDTLLEALAHLPEAVHLTLAGGGRCAGKYRQLSERLGIAGRVAFAGQLAPEALRELYRRVACVVMPSRFPEPFGLVGVEAMRYGTPVVATGVGGMTEWLRHEETGLSTGGNVAANDPVRLAAAITRLRNDPELARRLGENARRHYLRSFHPEPHITALHRLFTQLTTAKRMAGRA